MSMPLPVAAVVLGCVRAGELRIVLASGVGHVDGGIHVDVPVSRVPAELRMPNQLLWVDVDPRDGVRSAWPRGMEEELFTGLLVVHWELPRLEVHGERRGLLGVTKTSTWLFPRFSPELAERHGFAPDRGHVRCFRVVLAGHASPDGAFGHKGVCRRELHVRRVLAACGADVAESLWPT